MSSAKGDADAPQIFRNLGFYTTESCLFATGIYGVVKTVIHVSDIPTARLLDVVVAPPPMPLSGFSTLS